MTSELRPCPFCGGDDLAVMELLSRGFRIECEGCGAYSPVIKDGPALLTAWNRRAEQAAELAKFKALAETLAWALEAIRSEAQREEGSWLHLKRCIAAQSAETLRQYKEARDAS